MRVRLFFNHNRAPKIDRASTGALIRYIVHEEGRMSEYINVVLVGDEYLLDINRKFLNHNYRTDVISFDLSESAKIEGEIYVSIDRAKVQAKRYRVSLHDETLRLVVHGVLHLTGLDDTTRSEKLHMRKRENLYIRRFQGVKTKA